MFFWKTVAFFARAVLSLRYKVRVEGMDQVASRLDPKKGILLLPNHPALMDPLLIFLYLWPKYKMRPLVIEYVYRTPFLKPLLKIVKALPIPNFETAVNQLKIAQAEAAIDTIAKGVKQKQAFILYPSGRLKNEGKEQVGGASGAHDIVKECPDANIILVRTAGLWGSSFSRAIIGRTPDIVPTLLKGVKTAIKNLIFFMPRREILIQMEANPTDLPRKGTRLEFNRYLENWYNHYRDEVANIHVDEPLNLVSYSFWKKDVPKPFQRKKKESNGTVVISKEARAKVYKEIRHILNNPDLEINPESNLALDLGMDSLNVAELAIFLMHNYDVGELHPENLETVQTVLEAIEGAGNAPAAKHRSEVTWPKEENRMNPQLPMGYTIPEAFLNVCQRMRSYAACGDDVTGVLSYKRMKLAVLVLAQHFKKLPEKHVAVLLPASVGAYIIILALQFARKVPVMLNWTLGPKYLEKMMELSGAKSVISSWKFLDRLPHVDFGDLKNHLLLMEDVRKSITLGQKLRGKMLSLRSVSGVKRAMKLNRVDQNDPCVILFTSGTEAVPKGVPLSHKNIIANQRSGLQCLSLKATDVLYGILPPFHSFGFSVTGLFPLLGGIRAAYYPDPTDGFALAEGVQRWKATIFCGAPSFLKGLFIAAEPHQLKTVKMFVSGAEKAPRELHTKVEKLKTGAQLIEGYGITECAPVLTINRPSIPSKGVGRVLPDVDVITIHPESLELLPKGAEGEICVRGPNVFNGYLGRPRSPFIEIEGLRWYRTGDIGHVEKDGSLILSGRLKRFTKVGGEMISLGAVEEALIKGLHAKSDDGPSIAICADEKSSDKAQLVLFTTIKVEREAANKILIHAGFSRLIKISLVRHIHEIPLMGAGKTDYRKLQEMIEKKNGT